MPSVSEATDALRVALQKKGTENNVQDAFDTLASCLVLLNSSSPSVQMILRLCSVLRQPLLPLFNACFQPALQLSSSVLSTVLGKLCDAHSLEDENLRAALDATADVVLSGILDFLDQKDDTNSESDGAVWEALYRIICEFFFRDSGGGPPTFSIPLCLSAYNTLTEIAARRTAVRNALRQRAILGGERLGAVISGTRDYLLLEALLMLFARLLPPINTTSQGSFRRVKFVKEVLGSPKLFKCGAELLDIMRKTSGTHWDDVAAKIIDALAKSDITYPQPFSIDEIDVCGRVFPQPLATDRLILDRRTFLANIIAENDDTCESLQIPYSHIRTITLDSSEINALKGKVLIIVYLTSPPVVANVEMKSPGASDLRANFLLQSDAMGRFMEALRRRGVGKLKFLNPPTRVEGKRRNISIGSGFKFTNDSSPTPPTASFEGKVQHVNQVYKTDTEDLTTLQAVQLYHSGDTSSSHTPDSQLPSGDEILAPQIFGCAVTEDSPSALKRATLIAPTDDTSRPYRASPLSLFPKNSTGTTHLLDDIDELSEISEFDFDNDTANEGAETRGSCNHRMVPKQRKTDTMQMNKKPNATSNGIKTFSEFASRFSDRTEDVAEISPKARKPLLTPESSMLGPSSSTQIDVSPKLLSNADTLFTAVDIELVDRLSVVPPGFVGADKLKKRGANKCGFFETELATTSAGKLSKASDFAEDELGQHADFFTRSPGASQGTHSRIDIKQDTSAPSRIIGSRGRREFAKTSSKRIIDVDDEYTPPRKKIREDRLRIEEDKVKSAGARSDVIHASRVKGYTKTTRRSAPGTDLNLDEPAELRSTCGGTRRSSRIKKRQAAAAGGVQPNSTCGKIRKGKRAAYNERNRSAAVTQQDTRIEIGHGTKSILSSPPVLPVVRNSPATQTNKHAPSVELSRAEKNTPETNSPKGCSVVACAANQPSVTPCDEPRENLDLIREVVSDAMQLVQDQPHIKAEGITNDLHLVSSVRTADNEVSQVQEIATYLVPLKESEGPTEPFRPIVELASPMEAVTIDLTINNSPAQEKSETHRSSASPLRQEVNIRTKLETPEQSDHVVTDDPAFVPPHRHRRHSVTFASPIEYVLDKKVKSRAQVSSLRFVGCSSLARATGQPTDNSSVNPTRIRRPASPIERNTLSPVRIPTGTVGVGHESSGGIYPRVPLPNSKLLQASGSAHDQIVDDVGIQDIVEVLNEIQAVIIRGVSDKFRNIGKDIRRSRSKLIQQVLDELGGMVVENANHFNGLLLLEEDYHKHCKALTSCWEELIDCNDRIALQFQNALKEHDQNISARVFPKSLLAMQPVFPRQRINA